MSRKVFLFIFLLLIFLSGIFTFSQSESQEIQFSPLNKNVLIDKNGGGEITIVVRMPEDYHIDKSMLSFSAVKGSDIVLDAVKLPKPESGFDPVSQKEMLFYRSGTKFKISFHLKKSLKKGTYREKIEVSFQGCAGVMCFLPDKRIVEFDMVLKNDFSGSGENKKFNRTSGGSGGEISNIFKRRGYVLGFVIIFFLGILTSFTPCVLPIIPITISVFGARGEKNKFKAFLLSLTYVLGIAIMYSALGVISVLTGSVFGQYMSNPYVIGIIGLIFIVLGLFMAGVFNFNVPASLQTKVSKIGGRGFLGAFSMGLVAGIIAAPCTGPVLGGILLFVSTTRSFILGFFMLFVYAFGIGLIFIVLGTFSSLISSMPKSGGWMDVIKSIFAIIMFLAGLYFLKNPFPQINPVKVYKPIFYIIAVILIIAGIISDSLNVDFMFASKKEKIRKSISLILITAGSFLILMNVLAPAKYESLNWLHNLDRAISEGKVEKKYVMADFYADWCLACKELDAKTYTDRRVEKELRRFILVKVDMTKNSEYNKKLARKYDIKGLPLVLFFDREGKEIKDMRVTGFIGPEKFLKILKKLK